MTIGFLISVAIMMWFVTKYPTVWAFLWLILVFVIGIPILGLFSQTGVFGDMFCNIFYGNIDICSPIVRRTFDFSNIF